MRPTLFSWLSYGLWIGLFAYLVIAAFGANRDTKTPLVQSLILAAGVVMSFVLPRLTIFRFVNFKRVNPLVSSLGLVVCVAGMGLFIWGRQQLGKNWSQGVSAKEDHQLVTSGPYRFVRNPMYSGGLVAAIGTAIAAGGGFVFLLIVLAASFIWRVGAENRLMEQQFPEDYPAYRKRTKALIPFVW